ncbi:cytoskeletal protein RodZ [Arthrobacter sp. TE12231]
MRTRSGRPALFLAAALMAAAGLAACTPNSGPAPSPSASTTAGTSSSSPTGSPSPDTETTSPAPSPSAAPLPSGPGQGNAELAIMIKPTETAAPTNFTLVCQNGVPAAESQHPNPAAACLAIKNNPSILSPVIDKDRACTQQYGGPQVATVTGVVDGRQVQATFSLKGGCEIAAWNAAKDVLGSSGWPS